nr:hypothetical protein CFP56_41673 [Quercus suber]
MRELSLSVETKVSTPGLMGITVPSVRFSVIFFHLRQVFQAFRSEDFSDNSFLKFYPLRGVSALFDSK